MAIRARVKDDYRTDRRGFSVQLAPIYPLNVSSMAFICFSIERRTDWI